MNKEEVLSLSNEEYFNEINNLRNSINKFTSDEYNKLIEMLSIKECGKSYSELDKSNQLWINEFFYYDNYYLWRNGSPFSSPQEVGNALKGMLENLTKQRR